MKHSHITVKLRKNVNSVSFEKMAQFFKLTETLQRIILIRALTNTNHKLTRNINYYYFLILRFLFHLIFLSKLLAKIILTDAYFFKLFKHFSYPNKIIKCVFCRSQVSFHLATQASFQLSNACGFLPATLRTEIVN